MTLAYNYSFNDNFEARKNHFDLWSDFLNYSENLSGNWFISQQVFRNHIIATAEENPTLFAKWVNDMVKVSGVKIRSRYVYARALKFLRRFKALNATKKDLSKAVTELLNAGLSEPEYALRALQKVNS